MRLPHGAGEGEALSQEGRVREAQGGCDVTPAFCSSLGSCPGLPRLLPVLFQKSLRSLAPQFMALPGDPRAEGTRLGDHEEGQLTGGGDRDPLH